MTLDDLQARRTRMIDYLKLKVDESDWHGVADAAMDLREIEAQIKTLQSLSQPGLIFHNVVYGSTFPDA